MSKLTAEQIAAQQAEWERWHNVCSKIYHNYFQDPICHCELRRGRKCTAKLCPILNRNDNEKEGE